MTLAEILSLCLFGGVCLGLMAGFPVAFTLGGVSLIFGLIGNAVGACASGGGRDRDEDVVP